MARFAKHVEGQEGEFVKGPQEEIVIVTVDPTTGKFLIKQKTKFDQVLERVQEKTQQCKTVQGHTTGPEFEACFSKGVVSEITVLEESKSALTKYRDLIANRLRNYTCADPTMETSPALKQTTLHVLGQTYHADVLFDMPSAKIWTVSNFITDEECEVMRTYAKPLLRRATVAAPDGTSIISTKRRANQAGYNRHQNDPNDPLVGLYQRILALTNSYTGYNLTAEGQEDFTVIQYDPTDEYAPHCDGACDGSVHIAGGRVATALMYCQVPEIGGATTFSKADVFIKPIKGMATFFSYMGHDGKMEEGGYTEHSGCPVLQGDKWVTTAWMREGVSHAQPWTIFDPNGVKILMEETAVEQTPDQEAAEAARDVEVAVGADGLSDGGSGIATEEL